MDGVLSEISDIVTFSDNTKNSTFCGFLELLDSSLTPISTEVLELNISQKIDLKVKVLAEDLTPIQNEDVSLEVVSR